MVVEQSSLERQSRECAKTPVLPVSGQIRAPVIDRLFDVSL